MAEQFNWGDVSWNGYTPDQYNLNSGLGAIGNTGDQSFLSGTLDTSSQVDNSTNNYVPYDSNQYNVPSFSEGSYVGQEQPGFFSGQQGTDRAFSLGQMGLAGLGIGMNLSAQKGMEKRKNEALAALDRDRDPNAGLYRSELNRLMTSPNAYLEDAGTQRRLQVARDLAIRKARLEGRNQLNATEMQDLQQVAQQDMYKRAEFLRQMLGQEDQRNRARAEIISNTPVPNAAQAVLPGLQSMFGTGQRWATREGLASDPSMQISPQARAQLQRNYGGILG